MRFGWCAGRRMVKPRISYSPHPAATPEAELNTLAACFQIILDSAQKRGRLPDKSGPDDAKGSKHDSRQKHYTG